MPNDNRLTQQEIDDLLNRAETQEHVFWDKELVVSYRLPSGFTVTGRGACIDPANFDLEIGRKVARDDAAGQLWQLEGYRKQLELSGAGVLPVPTWTSGGGDRIPPHHSRPRYIWIKYGDDRLNC